ncbi:MAG TPA: ankyrin repeat domain-containing protein [Acidobacteriota bacterium]
MMFQRKVFLLSFILCFSVLELLGAEDSDRNLQLIRACAGSDIAKVSQLIGQGADVNARHRLTGWCALGTAAFYGSPEIVELLIQKGADVNWVDVHGRTPLMKAVTLGPYDSKREILSRKARIAKILLDSGANPYTPDAFGESVWQMPIVEKLPEIVRVFNQAGIKESNEVNLISAVARGDTATVKSFLAKGADVHFQDGYGWSALRESVVRGNPQIVALLIESGANVNARYPKGWTALMMAVKNKQPAIAKILLKAKADADATNDNGESAKDIARRQGDSAILGL